MFIHSRVLPREVMGGTSVFSQCYFGIFSNELRDTAFGRTAIACNFSKTFARPFTHVDLTWSLPYPRLLPVSRPQTKNTPNGSLSPRPRSDFPHQQAGLTLKIPRPPRTNRKISTTGLVPIWFSTHSRRESAFLLRESSLNSVCESLPITRTENSRSPLRTPLDAWMSGKRVFGWCPGE
jgi:hypothetical protein